MQQQPSKPSSDDIERILNDVFKKILQQQNK